MSEWLDIVDENGMPTGEMVERSIAHRDGIRHRTAHIWITRKYEGRRQVLLQKRSEHKDSFPGKFDTSAAGHMQAGDEPLEAALRELEEELGISAEPSKLTFISNYLIDYSRMFHERMFRDQEVVFLYIYTGEVDEDALILQEEEVSEVRWFDLEMLYEEADLRRDLFCVPRDGLACLREYHEKQEA